MVIPSPRALYGVSLLQDNLMCSGSIDCAKSAVDIGNFHRFSVDSCRPSPLIEERYTQHFIFLRIVCHLCLIGAVAVTYIRHAGIFQRRITGCIKIIRFHFKIFDRCIIDLGTHIDTKRCDSCRNHVFPCSVLL